MLKPPSSESLRESTSPAAAALTGFESRARAAPRAFVAPGLEGLAAPRAFVAPGLEGLAAPKAFVAPGLEGLDRVATRAVLGRARGIAATVGDNALMD